MSGMIDRDWRIAIHEAGHVVIARVLGLPDCGEASVIEPDAHALFCLDHGAPSICALFAGAAAEVELIGDHDAEGCGIDMERAREHLEDLGYTDGGSALWAYTLDLVHDVRHRSLIACVASKLRRAQMLDGAALDEIVARRMQWWEPPSSSGRSELLLG
jgi:hypothetical protein